MRRWMSGGWVLVSIRCFWIGTFVIIFRRSGGPPLHAEGPKQLKDFTNHLPANAKAPVNTGAFTRVKTSRTLHESVVIRLLLRQVTVVILFGARLVVVIVLRRLI